MFRGIRKTKIAQEAFASNGTVTAQIAGLFAADRSFSRLRFILDVVVTTGGAAALITGDLLARLIKSITVGDRIITTGQIQRILSWHLEGQSPLLAPDVPAANAEAHRRTISFDIAFENLLGPAGLFGQANPVPAMFEGKPVVVQFEDVTVAPFASVGGVAGTLRIEVHHTDHPSRVIPAIMEIGSRGVGTQDYLLSGERVYESLVLVDDAGGLITNAEVATVQLFADGTPLFDQPVRVEELVREFNENRAGFRTVQATHATAPVTGGALPVTPSAAAGGTAAISLPWLPLLSPARGTPIEDLLHVQRDLRIVLTGTQTNGMTVAWRAYQPRSDAQKGKAAKLLGMREDVAFRVRAMKDAPRMSRFASLVAA